MLLHGIMSSIAEFYSQNLATEVKKGMGHSKAMNTNAVYGHRKQSDLQKIGEYIEETMSKYTKI